MDKEDNELEPYEGEMVIGRTNRSGFCSWIKENSDSLFIF